MTGSVFGPQQRPVLMMTQQFLELLDDLRSWIVQGDSMEGSLAYEWGNEFGTYRVHAALRNGNSMGQGGMRMVMAPAEQTPVESSPLSVYQVAVQAIAQFVAHFPDSMAREDLWENNPHLNQEQVIAAGDLAEAILTQYVDELRKVSDLTPPTPDETGA